MFKLYHTFSGVRLNLTVIVGLTLFVALPTYAANLESASYKIYGGQVNEIVGEPSSTNYNLNSGANAIEGDTSSANYKLQSGSALSFPSAASTPTPTPSPSSGDGGANGPIVGAYGEGASGHIATTSTTTDTGQGGKFIEGLGDLIISIFSPKPPPTLTLEEIDEFPDLPGGLRLLTRKFPSLASTFRAIGIKDFNDIDRLSRANFILPSFDELDKIPTDIVFARSGDKLISFNTQLKIAKSGLVTQFIHVISGYPVNLAVRPSGSGQVKEITGYLVLRESNFSQIEDDPSIMLGASPLSIPASSLTASIFLAQASMNVDTEPKKVEKQVEDEFLLNKFTYTDPDGDGIYTTTITAPFVASTYEVITNITYTDGREVSPGIRLILIVDPEGYVYTTRGGLEARVPDALVSIYWRNPELNNNAGEYVLWPAREYNQRNPQITEKQGEYSFLVPPGEYYLTVANPQYHPYTSEPFVVTEGSGVHMNIELAPIRAYDKIIVWIGLPLFFLLLLLLLYFLKRRKRDIDNYNYIKRKSDLNNL